MSAHAQKFYISAACQCKNYTATDRRMPDKAEGRTVQGHCLLYNPMLLKSLPVLSCKLATRSLQKSAISVVSFMNKSPTKKKIITELMYAHVVLIALEAGNFYATFLTLGLRWGSVPLLVTYKKSRSIFFLT